MAKKYTKRHDAHVKLLFCYNIPIAFYQSRHSRCRGLSSLLL